MVAVLSGGGPPMALAAVATIGFRHVPMVASRRGYIRFARRRKGAHVSCSRQTRARYPGIFLVSLDVQRSINAEIIGISGDCLGRDARGREDLVAEGAGFEPAMELPPYTLSRRAP